MKVIDVHPKDGALAQAGSTTVRKKREKTKTHTGVETQENKKKDAHLPPRLPIGGMPCDSLVKVRCRLFQVSLQRKGTH